MSRNLGFPLLILLTIGLGTLLYYYSCSSCSTSASYNAANQVITSPSVPTRTAEFDRILELVYPNGEVSRTASNFVFGFSSPHFDLPIHQDINPVILQLRTFLDQNPDKHLLISGYYRADESNPSGYSNLGIARANQIKEYLKTQEFSTQQLRLKGLVSDSLGLSYGKIWGPISWRIEREQKSLPARMDSVRQRFQTNPIVLEFDTERSGQQWSAQQKADFTLLASYLDWDPTAIVEVIGHSEDTGSDEESYRMGMKRAEFVRRHLIDNAIPKNRITTQSAGHNQPIASNRTTEGRNRNKRVVIKL
jgi:outer membrane protein OmpA-like peptidoglycan-associated protein